MAISSVHTEKAPQAIGPYSQAAKGGSMLFVSGQLPIDPATGSFVSDNVEEQTHQSLKNLGAILEKEGLTYSDVVRCDIFLKDLNDFQIVNKVYASYFNGEHPPARQTVEVSRLPMDAQVEISCIAILK